MQDIHVGALFSPQAVAVVGPCHEEGTVAARFLARLREWAYQGAVTAVNCRDSLPETLALAGVDLAVVCLPPAQVPGAVERLARAGVRAALVPGSGFADRGGEGYFLEKRLAAVAQEANVAVLGPHCLGVVSWPEGLNASLLEKLPPSGGVAFFSPSATVSGAVVDWAVAEGVGFSRLAALGNRAAVDEASILQYLAEDTETRVIAGYLEGVFAARRFARVSQTVTRMKPVVMLLGGLTAQGRQAVAAAAGPLAGSEAAYRAALRQAGIIGVSDLETFLDTVKAFALLPEPSGPHVAILTNSGGAGVLAADALSATRLELARFSRATAEALRRQTGAWPANPLDLGAEATPEDFAAALRLAVADPRVRLVLAVIARPAGTDVQAVLDAMAQVDRQDTPVALCVVGERPGALVRQAHAQGMPCFSSPAAAARALDAMLAYGCWKEEPFPVEVCYRRDSTKAELWLREAMSVGHRDMAGPAVFPLLEAYELRHPATELARTSKTAARIARRLGAPVALKIASPHIQHKSDVDGVDLGLADPEAVRQGFVRLTHRVQRLRPEAFISGCWVQEMIAGPVVEARVWVVRDPLFGPVVRLGLCDGDHHGVNARLAPLSLTDASRMVREFTPLAASRGGRQPMHLRALEDVLLTVSQLALDMPELYTVELDPVLITPRGAWIVDARVCLVPVE
jgi:acetyltransferase